MTDNLEVTKEDLTDKQLELLEMIRKDPDATQKEFAEELGITPAAIGSRVRQIPGMNWMSRRWFVEEFFDEEDTDQEPAIDGQVDEQLDEIQQRVQEVEEEVADLAERIERLEEKDESGIEDPEMVRKMVLSITNSDRFTEEETDLVLKKLIG